MNSRRFFTKLSLLSLLCFIFLSISLISTTQEVTSLILRQQISPSQDTVRPEIHDWGIDGSVNTDNTVTIWANVTDTVSGVLNVSAVVREDLNSSSITRSLMNFNGTYFTTSLGPFEVNHTYYIWVISYDTALNLAQSYYRQYDLHVYTSREIDPTISFPYVVSGSLITMAVAIVLARWFYLKNPRPQTATIDDVEKDRETTESQTS